MSGPTSRITVLATEGSAPRGAGATMVVTADAAEGTIGGGQLEFRAIEQARRLLDQPDGAWRVQDYPLGPLLGQCCGGRVRLLIERRDAGPEGEVLRFTSNRIVREEGGAPAASARGPRPEPGDRIAAPKDRPRTPLLLFGAGHVGQAVARAIADLPFRLAWFDTRPDQGTIPGVVTLDADTIDGCIEEATAASAIVIMTHDHGLDYRLSAAALRTPARFIGLIGSATKRARFAARLTADGIDPARLRCPVGIPGIGGKEPAVIAASVAAQLLLEARP